MTEMELDKQIMPALLKPREVADALRVTPATVYRWISTGTIYAVQLGGPRTSVRIPKSEVVRLASPREAASLASGPSRRPNPEEES